MMHLIGESDVFFAVCCRALGKSFLVALAAVVYCLLYPFGKVVITAVTIDQASKMVQEKIKNELVLKLSPVLKYLYEQKLITFKISDDRAEVFFWNGSSIIVCPALESSRGYRANFLVYEECRLLSRSVIDSIFEPMSYPRQPMYLQNDKYLNDQDCLEDARSVYITSSRTKNELNTAPFYSNVKLQTN